ncbi:transposable element Tcb1 transposase [Trichonephila clavipes]|nr:transposable element Tcb1 transposase [Trichonephila clavipes]
MSARRPLLHLPLTDNHRRLRRQSCEERRAWTTELNDIAFTDESCFCLQHHYGRIRVWRHRARSPPIYLGLTISHIPTERAHTRHAVFKSSSPIRIELLPWPVCAPDRKRVVHSYATTVDRDTLPSATPDQLWQYTEAA